MAMTGTGIAVREWRDSTNPSGIAGLEFDFTGLELHEAAPDGARYGWHMIHRRS